MAPAVPGEPAAAASRPRVERPAAAPARADARAAAGASRSSRRARGCGAGAGGAGGAAVCAVTLEARSYNSVAAQSARIACARSPDRSSASASRSRARPSRNSRDESSVAPRRDAFARAWTASCRAARFNSSTRPLSSDIAGIEDEPRAQRVEQLRTLTGRDLSPRGGADRAEALVDRPPILTRDPRSHSSGSTPRCRRRR